MLGPGVAVPVAQLVAWDWIQPASACCFPMRRIVTLRCPGVWLPDAQSVKMPPRSYARLSSCGTRRGDTGAEQTDRGRSARRIGYFLATPRDAPGAQAPWSAATVRGCLERLSISS